MQAAGAASTLQAACHSAPSGQAQLQPLLNSAAQLSSSLQVLLCQIRCPTSPVACSCIQYDGFVLAAHPYIAWVCVVFIRADRCIQVAASRLVTCQQLPLSFCCLLFICMCGAYCMQGKQRTLSTRQCRPLDRQSEHNVTASKQVFLLRNSKV